MTQQVSRAVVGIYKSVIPNIQDNLNAMKTRVTTLEHQLYELNEFINSRITKENKQDEENIVVETKLTTLKDELDDSVKRISVNLTSIDTKEQELDGKVEDTVNKLITLQSNVEDEFKNVNESIDDKIKNVESHIELVENRIEIMESNMTNNIISNAKANSNIPVIDLPGNFKDMVETYDETMNVINDNMTTIFTNVRALNINVDTIQDSLNDIFDVVEEHENMFKIVATKMELMNNKINRLDELSETVTAAINRLDSSFDEGCEIARDILSKLKEVTKGEFSLNLDGDSSDSSSNESSDSDLDDSSDDSKSD
jgi:chromosome segregation ATPase